MRAAPPRFAGEEAEPRAGLRRGHIPGSRNIPYTQLTAEDGTMKSPDDLRALFVKAGLDLARPIVTSCGSGITAATLLLALHVVGADKGAVYDGSWAEWGASDEAPLATGTT